MAHLVMIDVDSRPNPTDLIVLPTPPTSSQDTRMDSGIAAPAPSFEPVDEDACAHIMCPVCLDPWDDPVELSPCRHVLCRGCVKQLAQAKCPQCRTDVKQRSAHPVIVNLANDVHLRCVCGWIGTREASRKHVRCEASSTNGVTVAEESGKTSQAFSVDRVLKQVRETAQQSLRDAESALAAESAAKREAQELVQRMRRSHAEEVRNLRKELAEAHQRHRQECAKAITLQREAAESTSKLQRQQAQLQDLRHLEKARATMGAELRTLRGLVSSRHRASRAEESVALAVTSDVVPLPPRHA